MDATAVCPPKVVVRFPEIYLVDRVYGGPEEGGWWWDSHELLKSFPPRLITSEKEREYLARAVDRLARFLNRVEGRRPLSSVLSDGQNFGTLAVIPGSLTTRERPRYN